MCLPEIFGKSWEGIFGRFLLGRRYFDILRHFDIDVVRRRFSVVRIQLLAYVFPFPE